MLQDTIMQEHKKVYLAAPIPMYSTREYQTLSKMLRSIYPTLIEAASSFTSNYQWLSTYQELLQDTTIVFYLPATLHRKDTTIYTVGAGVYTEYEYLPHATHVLCIPTPDVVDFQLYHLTRFNKLHYSLQVYATPVYDRTNSCLLSSLVQKEQ